MKTFDSIVDVTQPTIFIPATHPTLNKEFYKSAPVPGNVVEHLSLGDGTKKWKIQPQKGIPWSVVKELEIIKMTPYAVGSLKVENRIVKLPRQSAVGGFNAHRTGAPSHPKTEFGFSGYILAHSTWNEQVSLVSLRGRYPYHGLDPVDYSKELNDVKSNVVSKSMNGLDLLTNLAELPDTLEMILQALKAARHPLQSAKEAYLRYMRNRDRYRRNANTNTAEKLAELDSDFRNQWLQYRYGIMPLILTIEDAVKLLDEKLFKFHTEHSGDTINVSATSKPIFNIDVGSYVYQNRAGTVKVRATGKAKYGSSGSRLSDLITFNPFLTAWELIPLSFVIDWFVNVGDVIFSNTSALMDISEQRSFCYSIKKEITTQTILFSSYDDSVWVKYKENASFRLPAFEKYFPLVYRSTDVMRTETEVSYERVLFSPTDVDFQFNPSLGWMRKLDAYALSFSSISKLLKKLR